MVNAIVLALSFILHMYVKERNKRSKENLQKQMEASTSKQVRADDSEYSDASHGEASSDSIPRTDYRLRELHSEIEETWDLGLKISACDQG